MKLKILLSLNRATFLAGLTIAGICPGNAQLASQYGILDLTANGGINPNTGIAWEAGDQYRLAFHTSGKIDATSNDPAEYDDFATSQAQENPALATSTGWTAMLYVNMDATVAQGTSPVSNPLERSGTMDQSGGAAQGGAGVPVYAMDGTTAIARNNADIYDSWSNPFESGFATPDPTGNGTNAQRLSGIFYSPFLDQFGSGDTGVIHGPDVWTGGFGSQVNPAGDTTDEVRTSHGNTNANNTDRTWNRFNRNNVDSKSVYALSELLTVGTGIPEAPFVLSIFSAVDPEIGFDLVWPSKEDKLYRIRSSATLDTDPVTWTIVAENIASAGETTPLNVTPGETKLFYVVEEYDAPDPE